MTVHVCDYMNNFLQVHSAFLVEEQVGLQPIILHHNRSQQLNTTQPTTAPHPNHDFLGDVKDGKALFQVNNRDKLRWIHNHQLNQNLQLGGEGIQAVPLMHFISLSMKKGIFSTAFFWIYLAALAYACGFLLSLFIPQFAFIGAVIKLVLVHFFPNFLQLEVFNLGNILLFYIFDAIISVIDK